MARHPRRSREAPHPRPLAGSRLFRSLSPEYRGEGVSRPPSLRCCSATDRRTTMARTPQPHHAATADQVEARRSVVALEDGGEPVGGGEEIVVAAFADGLHPGQLRLAPVGSRPRVKLVSSSTDWVASVRIVPQLVSACRGRPPSVLGVSRTSTPRPGLGEDPVRLFGQRGGERHDGVAELVAHVQSSGTFSTFRSDRVNHAVRPPSMLRQVSAAAAACRASGCRGRRRAACRC